ncbi:hypothetical protein GCM10010435_44740 [Winogradskya consettensis]|uniref:Excreted virulence factor EspC (Type VII ESX diderm) n=1 Tax=Winogradskya consettensis TaxID=113560 RepID=A0A919T0J2_9ACTN|nr:type VII secretion target [Actinoplanes consettensis]GIM82760.1 hypothetical protein Aco04nite_83130 [Actinoplanes consettensis]
MTGIADRLEAAADSLTGLERALPMLAASPGSFGADGEGLPGRVGGQLHQLWASALAARSREAADAARHVTGLAAEVRAAAKAYTETDDEAGRRIRRSGREN